MCSVTLERVDSVYSETLRGTHVGVKMQRLIEQRYSIKFCVKLGKSATETNDMIKLAYKDEAMSRTRVFEWYSQFKNGREEVEDEQRAGRPSTSKTEDNVTKIRDLLNTDRHLSVRLIAQELDLPKTIVHEVVTEILGMRKVCAKLVPKILTGDNKQRRVIACQEMIARLYEDPNFLDRVVTGDESWVFEYDPETKRQSSEWHTKASPKSKKARMSKSRVKSMLITFFDAKGVIHREFLPAGQTVTGAFYLQVLRRLKARVSRVRPEIAEDWILHHDNAPSHTCFVVSQFLAKNKVATLNQPPYSPDLAPSDFFLFPRLKKDLKGRRFDDVAAVQMATTTGLSSIPVSEFQGAYESWKKRWQRCIDAEGSYFEEY